MTLLEFKASNNISKLPFYKSENGRFVSSFWKNGKEIKIISRTGFDPSPEKSRYVYKNNILADPGTGEIVENLYWLSNAEPKKAAFIL